MPVSIGDGGQPGFDQPIDLMKDCHRRIEHFLGVLQKVAAHGGGLDSERREALTTALRYFKSAAPRHTEDEEQSLFPRMRELLKARAARGEDIAALGEALRQVEELEEDHVLGARLHDRVDELGWRWLERGRLSADDVGTLRSLIDQLEAIYQRHIPLEDDHVFPAAMAALAAQELDAIGQEMAARRVENPGRPDSRCGQRRRDLIDAGTADSSHTDA